MNRKMTGAQIHSLRTQYGLTAAQLGELLGTSISSVFRWESLGQAQVAIDPAQLRVLTMMDQQLRARDATRRDQFVKSIGSGLLVGGGLLGLYFLLQAAFSGPAEGAADRQTVGAVARDIPTRAKSPTRRTSKKGGKKP
jgi:hypothetical protein